MIHTHVCLSAGFVALISPIFPQNKSPRPTPIPPWASSWEGTAGLAVPRLEYEGKSYDR